tara:strand:- start:127 stop:717 length:591 start_codon:yes stop_codon:yes gene_type:complete
MCFSFEISISTFVVSWSISLYLLNKGLTEKNKQYVIALMIFSSMQLVDAVLWYRNMKKDKINYIVTSFAIPSILSILIIHNVYFINNNKNRFIDLVTIIACIYLFIRFNGYSTSICNMKSNCSKKSGLESPVWGSKEIELWELILFMIIIFYPRINTLLQTLFILIPIIYFYAGGAYGSLWCALANICAFFYLYKF